MNIDLSNAPADAEKFDEYKEEVIEKLVESIKADFQVAKKKKDYDDILKKYKIKVIRNKKKASPMQEKVDMKKKIIQFAIHEPEDYFDLDVYTG